ncbi:MAG: dienelactone hydrolase family protein, partial [Paraglaciecola sp.]|nr:dienelactone hydrolase family protein [Paraglaciecola sp.]
MIIQHHQQDINTATGTMHIKVYRPVQAGTYNAIIFYSEIFQLTAPIAR